MTQATRARSDSELIEELGRALRYERRRAPADLLVLLAGAIVLGAALCVVVGTWVGDGVAQVFFLNLSTELMGALVTVILIGALWQQLQRSAIGGVDALSRAVEERRERGLTDDERLAFERLLEIHRRTASARPVIRQLRALAFTISHRSELSALERVLEQRRPA
jgi:hypothetical protein